MKLACLLCLFTWSAFAVDLTYAPAPLDNPLKGIAANYSVSGAALASFPHSLNTRGFPINAIMTGPTNFDWSTFESFLNSTTNDGSQAIPLFYVDYPAATATSYVPDYVLTNGLTTWEYTFEGAHGLSPDYSNTNLQACLQAFITALGAKYDGDPRIAFLRMGTIGVWGEWHYGPPAMASHWATANDQRVVMDAFTNAFRQTKIMMRYPAGTNEDAGGVVTAHNHDYPVGYHDDSFCRTTVPTNWPANSTVPNWQHMAEMVIAGATNHWKYWPNGGELSSSLYVGAFSNSPVVSPLDFGIDQTWSNAVMVTHSSWIHDWAVFYTVGLYGSGIYYYGPGGTNALLGSRELGYELWVKSYSMSGQTLTVTMTNTGVAPFYYDWAMEVSAVTNGSIAKTWSVPWTLTSVVPGDGDVNFTTRLSNGPKNACTLVMRAINPMANGKKLRFANSNQHATITNYLTLGDVTIPGGQVNVGTIPIPANSLKFQ